MKGEKPSTGSLAEISTGQALAEAAYLEAHFRTAQAEYEALVHSVGIQKGWQVLDAGCGGGDYLPLISRLVGPNGQTHALDLAPEHIELINQRIEGGILPNNIQAQTGSVIALPYDSDQFDAVWCANLTQYLSDEELEQSLNEFYRVTKPGGVVAIKEFDGTALQIQPTNSLFVWRLMEAGISANVAQCYGVIRTNDLPSWFKQVGFKDIWRKTSIAECTAPLKDFERDYMGPVIQVLSQLIPMANLDENELQQWQNLNNSETGTTILDHPDFYWREPHLLVVGRVE